MSKNNLLLSLSFIFLLAFALRLTASGLFEGIHSGPSPEGFGVDGVEFNQIAENLALHHQFSIVEGSPTTFRAPGFPLLLAGIYEIFGVDNFFAARVCFALIGTLLVFPVFFLTREITNDFTAMIAALLAAIYPNLIYYNIHFASEPLYTLLLTTSIFLFLRASKALSSRDFFMSGLLLGMAALTRPVAVLFIPFFAIAILFLYRRNFLKLIFPIAVFAFAAGLVIAPWTLRNYLAQQQFVMITTNGGSTFWGSNNQLVLDDPQLHGDWVTTETFEEQKNLLRDLSEAERDRHEWQYGKSFLKNHPQVIPRLLWYKFYAFWTPILKTPNHKFNLLVGLSYGLLLPFILAGSWLFFKRRKLLRRELLILIAPIFATLMSVLVFYGSSRFRCTIEPLLLVFAATAISGLVAMVFKQPAVFPFEKVTSNLKNGKNKSREKSFSY
ncbi:MAG: glycosyltransferase family 39 protein [Acidobacteriota bacterium]